MKNTFYLVLLSLVLFACKENTTVEEVTTEAEDSQAVEKIDTDRERILKNKDLNQPKVYPISHATFYMIWDGQVIYIDPVGGKAAFGDAPAPDFILVTDIHGDHMDPVTINEVLTQDTKIYAPQAVVDQLPKDIPANVINNGMVTTKDELTIRAIPMYNLTEERLKFHAEGRGNGYVLTKYNYNVYISGDTEDIPEMRNLKDIDLAFVTMNLPYTMTENQAADAVLEFKPRTVVPYHYRGQNGYSDIIKFKQLIAEDNSEIKVLFMPWYGESDMGE